ncbi:PREDICTED: 3beta-hydroxysteroid-dehydrogenase/decarboxylase-like [Lupinus angustifolius]|uniref:3beta-hydroxysteroid- dehydrogenase/decarboxylase-like n=1 Tax=Lupinus angustifolius TaxID=3871 RepID=UPI00092ED2EC|nr:PREDICTED: 3beta-hydroxysteroid-dehydrogenase/decarboxylase-like [Lupinus angustifolius]XP_019417427.1 PREDICTED: 3beta-hydroxysteroid-dehydrogenase/decarboxylase-like [Lupinus angustifolius]
MGGDGGERWCVVTGGRGFAARHLVEMLIHSNTYSVRIADLGSTIDLEPSEQLGILGEALTSGRAQYVTLDLRNKEQVLKACEGAEVVFHMAAPNSSINSLQLHQSVNVQGTKNVIDACLELKVKRLIYTSSPSVVFDGIHGIHNGNETLPYPPSHNDHYSATKAEGEGLVIKANGKDGLLTCCIRPSSIFGPGDKLLVPSLVDAARAGKSKFIIGDGNNLYDFTYVENVAHAHICAERALASEGKVSEKAAGEAYFITNMEPIKFWEFLSLILEGLGYERPRIKIPASVIMPIAHLVELIYKLLGPYGMKVPQFTPSRVRLLSCSRSFDCSKAKDRLGYAPIITLQEGLRRTIDSYPHLRAENQPKTRREGPSKSSIYLGRGRVADTLLWKDRKQTFTTLLVLAAIYFNFIASGNTIITAVSKLLLFISIFLFIHGILPAKILGYNIEKIPPSGFHLSDNMSHQIALSVASSWNFAVNVLKSLAQGNNLELFSKVVFSLVILSFLGGFSLQSLYIIGIAFVFVAFYVYEKKEEDIDGIFITIHSFGCKLKSDFTRKFLLSKKID